MPNPDILSALNWRYATKEFDPDRRLTPEQLGHVLEALRLSPSSFGLQPWSFVVVENKQTREALVGHSWGQRQVADASHLIVLCRRAEFTPADVEKFLALTAETRGAPIESLDAYKGMMFGFLEAMDEAKLAHWMELQVYLALGNLLTACAVAQIDACPMEGFSAPDYDEKLALPDRGLRSVVVCPIGYRKDTDKYASAAKVRNPVADLTVTI